MRVLVAGVGNVLRGDDGFGVAVADLLAASPLPAEVRVMDVGIGGIHLVQELMRERADALIVLDAVELGRRPGTVLVLRPEVLDLSTMGLKERNDQLADMHYATPERAFMLARALEVLPQSTWVVGCQPVDARSWVQELSSPVSGALETAQEEVRRIVREMGIAWPRGPVGN